MESSTYLLKTKAAKNIKVAKKNIVSLIFSLVMSSLLSWTAKERFPIRVIQYVIQQGFQKTVNKGAQAEAGIEIRALKGPWNQNSSVKDKFAAILTPEKANIETLGPCTTRGQCWRTEIGYDVITQKFVDLENE